MSNTSVICLTMIAKNEGKIIIRCLESCVHMIDYVCITVNGTTDDTVYLVEKFLQENNINGKVFQSKLNREFEFGLFRTESYHNAVSEMKKYKNCHYLLLDCDMMLRSNISKNELKEIIKKYVLCELYQVEDNVKMYPNIRLLNGKYKWVCRCTTHEFWECTNRLINRDAYIIPKHLIYIEDIGDGCNKSDKLKRDLRLLEKGYNEETEEDVRSRYIFYKGITHFCLGDYLEAIECFNRRAESKGWIEEIFYSKYMIGRVFSSQYAKTKDKKYLFLARNSYIEAWLYRPIRIEPLYWLCLTEMNFNMFDDNKFVTQNNVLVYMYCRYIVDAKIPQDRLFIEHQVYQFQVKYLLYICSFYAQDREVGNKMYDLLMKDKNVCDGYRRAIETFKKKNNW